jgi:hypothetical protein
MDLYIDPALQAVIPPPTNQERAQLEANLLADGSAATRWSSGRVSPRPGSAPRARQGPRSHVRPPLSRPVSEASSGCVGSVTMESRVHGRCSTATPATPFVAPMALTSPSSRRLRGCRLGSRRRSG